MSVNMRWLIGGTLAGLLLLSGCFLYEEDKPEVVDYGLTLEAVDVVCTEAIFKAGVRIQEAGGREDLRLGLFRNDSLVVTDSLLETGYLRDEGLEPNTTYSYSLVVIDEEGERIQQQSGDSSFVTIMTMDTTSHDFDWEIITLGDYGSYFNDVAIVDENNIWAVGLIKTDTATYNAAHWNGNEWEMKRILSGHTAVNSIWYFNEDDIWAALGVLSHWDGEEWTLYHLWDMGILAQDDGGVYTVWASSPEDIWFAGKKGSLVHYDGEHFKRVENPWQEKLDWVQLKGCEDRLYVVGNHRISPYNSALAILHNEEWTTLMSSASTNGIWDSDANTFSDWGHMNTFDIFENHIYVHSVRAIMKFPSTQDYITRWWMIQDYPSDHYIDMNVHAPNDIVVISNEEYWIHYNGKDWKTIRYDNNPYNETRALARLNDLVIIVGSHITIGRKL